MNRLWVGAIDGKLRDYSIITKEGVDKFEGGGGAVCAINFFRLFRMYNFKDSG